HTHTHTDTDHTLRRTEKGGEFRQQANLHHATAQACVEGEIEQQTQRDIQQVLMVTWHQPSQTLHRVDLSLGIQRERKRERERERERVKETEREREGER